MPSLKKQAKKIAKKGRKGDSQLIHITRDELMSLMGTGRVTKNPETGLPEASGLTNFFNNPVAFIQDHDPFRSVPAAPGSPQATGNAISANDWGNPFSGEANSYDMFAGGDSSKNPYIRDTGRLVGSIFAGEGIGTALGGGGEAAGASGGGGGANANPTFDPAIDSSPAATGDPGVVGGSGGSGPSSDFGSNPEFSDPVSNPPVFGSSGGGEGMGMPGETTSGGTVPGDIGGDPWWNRLGKMGDYLPALKTAGNAVQIAGGAYGLYNAYQGRQAQKQQQKQQQQYFDQLNNLRANPGQVTSMPGYQFNLDQGNEALARRMASMGYGSSGNLAIATQRYGQDYATSVLGNEEQLLASQYGRATAPTQQMPDPTQLAMRSLSNMGYGFGGA